MSEKQAFRILIVEDDKTISHLLSENLSKWDFTAFETEDFSDIMPRFRETEPHLVIMDISLPFYNGYYWCGEIRKESSVPILFLTSHNEDSEIVMAVALGADDYITKPFATDVLVAKIRAILRRTYSYTEKTDFLGFGELKLSLNDFILENDGKKTELTKNEHRILRSLLERANKIVSRDELMRALWESENFIDDNTLTVNINRLRKKLEQAGLGELIKTKKGFGYIIYDKNISE